MRARGGDPASGRGVERREFLRRAGLLTGAAVIGSRGASVLGNAPLLGNASGKAGKAPRPTRASALDGLAADAGFDTVVVVMMENRSFDHMLGWTGTDAAYLEAGRSRYGADFHIDGKQNQSFKDHQGEEVASFWIPGEPGQQYPYEGCGEGIPGHSWRNGRVQRDQGFLAKGSGNTKFAVGYYDASDMAMYEQLVRRFTTGDRWFSSLLGPTFPNRQYLYAAQSAGQQGDPGPLRPGMFHTKTIWDNLVNAKVPSAYYYTDLPILPLWGKQFYDITHSLDEYFDDASKGRLANVVMIDPGFQIALRTDDHPVGDIRRGQRWLRSVFQAFAQSPHWERGVFVLIYDEWGGFFDHVRPPVVADARRSKTDGTNFGQLGFRVPAIVASPFAREGYADHTAYDHTSVLRMLEWRFLGAPAEGTAAGKSGQWWLTPRDRNAANLARTLTADANPDLGFDLTMDLPAGAAACTFGALGGAAHGDPFANTSNQMADLQDSRFKTASEAPWQRGN